MDPESLPVLGLRREVVICLAGYADSADAERMPILSPRGLLTMLNKVGPETGERWLPLIEATLDAMWQEGLVGRIPAPSPDKTHGYCCRRFAERAIRQGAPIILRPRANRTSPGSRPPHCPESVPPAPRGRGPNPER